MDVDANDPGQNSLHRRFPWTRLVGGVRLALESRKLILASLGVVLTWAGWAALDAAFPASAEVTPDPMSLPWVIRDSLVPESSVLGAMPWQGALRLAADPVIQLATPFRAIFQIGGDLAGFAHAVLATVWVLLVWGVIGAAISRAAVLELASGERIGIVRALGFGLRKIVPLLWAPIGALLGVAFFAALCALVGLLYRIPGPTGATIAGLLFFLPLLAAVVMSLILIGLAAGWPLMVATIATEDEDAFDALSRAYSYVYQRPLAYACLVLVAWVVGSVGFLLVLGLASLVVHLAVWALAFGAPDTSLTSNLLSPGMSEGGAAVVIHRGWTLLVALLAYGWVYAYFWSSVTQVYLLLRRDVDGAPFHDVASTQRAADHQAPMPAPPVGVDAKAPDSASA